MWWLQLKALLLSLAFCDLEQALEGSSVLAHCQAPLLRGFCSSNEEQMLLGVMDQALEKAAASQAP